MTILYITESTVRKDTVICSLYDDITNLLISKFDMSSDSLKTLMSSIDMEGIEFVGGNISIDQGHIIRMTINNIDRLLTITKFNIANTSEMERHIIPFDNVKIE